MANNIITRTSAENLASDPGRLDALRDATGKMQAISGTDNRSAIYWAGLHGYPQWQCWHHGKAGLGQQKPYNLFLPWHRAYLLHVEHAMRDQNPDACIPWWDWTSPASHRDGVPKAYSDKNADGNPNPLYSGPVPPLQNDPARSTTRYPGRPSGLPTTERLESLLSLNSFIDFQLALEDVHDFIHGWTGGLNPATSSDGGDMGNVGTAAYDPVFWAHHAMIDRIWYLWQLRHGVQTIPPDYLGKPLAPFSMTVEAVLDINRLGYEYGTASISLTAQQN